MTLPQQVRAALGALGLAWLTAAQGGAIEEDWPGWRGPTHDGVAAPGQNPPLRWGPAQNVVWKAPVPGRGHSSPTAVGDRVYLATADEEAETQSVLCYHRRSGRLIWTATAHRGGLDKGGHKRASQASSTVACDGERLFANFLNDGAVWTTAFSLDGKRLWRRKISDFTTHQGFGSSPHIYKSTVIVSSDNKGGGAVVALDRATGREIWRRSRPRLPNYTSPVALRVDGRDQLLLSGCDLISSFNPLTGATLWEIPGSTTECVVTMVTDGQRVFTSGGYPKNHAVAALGDGSGETAWRNNQRVYVPSMIVRDGHLFAVADAGFAICWRSDTGEEIWKERIGGEYFSSPVYANGRIYAVSLSGRTAVFKADPNEFAVLAVNPLGDEAYAAPAISHNRIYLRIAELGQERQEFLYCLGSP